MYNFYSVYNNSVLLITIIEPNERSKKNKRAKQTQQEATTINSFYIAKRCFRVIRRFFDEVFVSFRVIGRFFDSVFCELSLSTSFFC